MRTTFFKYLTGLLISTLVSLPLIAAAEMQIDNSIIIFKSDGAARQDVTITNNGDTPLYLKVTPFKIANPGGPDEKRTRVIDPRTSGLLVSPHKLVIAPAGKKRIRFVNLRPMRDKEAVFRVTIQPVVGKLTARSTGIKVMVGYEVLVLAEPANPKNSVVAKRHGNRLVIVNQGNTNALLFRGKQCPTENGKPEGCFSLQDRRLYPGNSWEIELPGEGPVEFHIANSEGNGLKTFH